MRVLAPSLLIFLLSFVPQQLPGVTAPGVVSGTVVDSVGAVIPGARVTLRAKDCPDRTAVTNVRGEFRFEAVPQGEYELEVVLDGFQTLTVSVRVGITALSPLRLTMEVGALSETVMVTADNPMLQASVAATGGGYFEIIRRGERFNTETYDRIDENPFRRVHADPLSTFSIDVDTASYSNVRRFLNDGELPPADAVRIEELVNYFRFSYKDPSEGEPFSVTTEVSACPWNPRHRLALVGLQARRMSPEKTPPRNLVFLLDVSGSMNEPSKLPLVKTAMRMLADTLTAADRVAIVVYAGASGVALPSTPGDRKPEIHRAIADLEPGGSTNGAAGIRLAYDLAAQNFIRKGINRVILATDGDFNVGVTSQGELIRLIEEKRESGVFLSVLGVGAGNLKDSTMEKLADKGNGNYSYLDTLHEARRVLIAEAGATLVTVAKDVKIQVEFNPRTVGAYRLIGYENRILAAEDFDDDKKDAGEIGAGHSVTAIYELAPAGESNTGRPIAALKYQDVRKTSAAAKSDELMTVSLRYKQPDGNTSGLISTVVRDKTTELTPNLGFASAVAAFGMLLRDSAYKGDASWESARQLAVRYRGDDADGYRAEFIRLLDLASTLNAQGAATPQNQR
jgi:Ca-activated chloride channel family protein